MKDSPSYSKDRFTEKYLVRTHPLDRDPYFKNASNICEDKSHICNPCKDHPDGMCSTHAKNGACLTQNPDHKSWRKRCPVACNVCPSGDHSAFIYDPTGGPDGAGWDTPTGIDCGNVNTWGHTCRKSCNRCIPWGTKGGIHCDAHPHRIECACTKCNTGAFRNSWEPNYYAKPIENEVLKLDSNNSYVTPNGKKMYHLQPESIKMSWPEQGNLNSPCNNVCKTALGSSVSGYCLNHSSTDSGNCCRCSTTDHDLDKTLSWHQPIQPVYSGDCKDLIPNCDTHMKNGGCLDANKDHDTWRKNCVKTCGYCNWSKYNTNF